jgi:hypothetical protein
VWAAVAWVGLVGLASGSVSLYAGCGPGKSLEVCTSNEDEDQDGRASCDDDDCWVQGGVCAEVCDTIFDEDGDGAEGCDDSDCWVAGNGCEEICDSDFDEDGDGAVACADDDCWIDDGVCVELCPAPDTMDDADEDGDGVTGCDDPDCWLPDGGCPERCDTEFDEDADGTTSCSDSDCIADPICIPTFGDDVQPILLEHCSGDAGACHSDLMALGGLSFDSYTDMALASNYCGPSVTKAACSLLRILEPSMPQDCLGCVPQVDVDVIQAWVDGGIPE